MHNMSPLNGMLAFTHVLCFGQALVVKPSSGDKKTYRALITEENKASQGKKQSS